MNLLNLVNNYLGFRNVSITPVYCKIIQEKVLVYANYSYQRNLIKFELDDILTSSLVSDDHKRRVLRTVAQHIYSGVDVVHDAYKIG